MKGFSSKLLMGAALVMAVTLALVLAIVLLLLAELYCSLLLRTRRNHRKRSPPPTTAAAAVDTEELSQHRYSPSLCSFYYQGVLPTPRSFLFPAPEYHLDLEKQPNSPISTFSATVGLPYYSSSSASTRADEHPLYICNPIYNVHEAMIGLYPKEVDTRFEMPDTSPSRLEDSPSGSSDSAAPPLNPMRKLPADGPSVSLREALSICIMGSDSNNSINYDGVISVSSSSSDSEKTSAPW